MPKMIKDGLVVENEWHLSEETESFPEGKILVSVSSWNDLQAQITERAGDIGIWMNSNERPEDIDNLQGTPVIAIRFDSFADGRGFSIARLLRERMKYQGEIRAIGAPIRDQISYMARCGFNAFELAEHYDPTEALSSLKDFAENYQGSVEQTTPLFRRRA